MATQAAIGHGSRFQMSDGGVPAVFTDIAEVTQITAPAFVRDVPDATHMLSPEKWREYIPGLRDPGEVSITMNFIPGGTGQDQMISAFQDDVARMYRVDFIGTEFWDFYAYCIGFAPEVPLDAKMTATARFKLTGKPIYVAA